MKILHISDLHFGFEKTETSKAIQLNYLSSLKNKLTDIANTEQINYILCTGDFTWKAEEEQFKLAEQFMLDVLSVFRLCPDNLYICPGNHDVDRRELEHWLFPENQHEANIHLSAENLDMLTRNFQRYIEFCDRLGTIKYSLGNVSSYLTGAFSNSDFNIICLNSAWYAKSKEVENKMWIGSNFLQVIKSSNIIDDTKPTIAIVHHPSDKWHEEETHNFPDNINVLELLCEMSDLVLSGHTHETECNISHVFGACVTGTGALYNDSSYQNTFYVYDITASSQNRTRYYFSGKDWKKDDPQRLGSGKLREKLNPQQKESANQTIAAFDKTISIISHKSLDEFSKNAYDFDIVEGSPVYNNSGRKQRAIEILEPFIDTGEGQAKYKRLLEKVLEKINNNENIVLKGMQGTGKSSFMSLLYMDILHMFRTNETTVYPIYIDIHNYIKRDTFESVDELADDIDNIKVAMNSVNDGKWVVFIDGIDEYESSTTEYEQTAASLIQEDERIDERIVLCVGMAEDVRASRGRSEKGDFSSYISMSKPLAVLQSIKQTDSLIEKILIKLGDVYKHKLSASQRATIKKWIKTYCNGFIDFRTFLTLFQIAAEDKDIEKKTLTKKLISYHVSRVGNSENALLEVAGVAAFYVTSDHLLRDMKRKQYSKKYENIIHRNKVARDFLLAYYWTQYVACTSKNVESARNSEVIKNAKAFKNAKVFKNARPIKNTKTIKNAKAVQSQISKWNVIFPRTVNRFIIDLLEESDETVYTANLMEMYEEASSEMKINIAYFLGRSNDPEVKTFLRKKWDVLFKDNKNAQCLNESDFRLLRSLSISLICARDKEVENNFLSILIKFPRYARWNLFMHCNYYFDRCEYSDSASTKIPNKEMFTNAFQGMRDDLNNVLENSTYSQYSKLSLRLDLITFFSMCVYSINYSQNEETINAAKKILASVEKTRLPKMIKGYANNCIMACELALK